MSTTYSGPMASTSGRLRAIAVAQSLNVDTPTWSGSLTSAIRSELTSLTGPHYQDTPNTSMTLESTADTNTGKLNPDQILGGTQEWSFQFTGEFRPDVVPATFYNGAVLYTRIVYKKNGATDLVYYDNVKVVLSNFAVTGPISPQTGLQMFSGTLKGSGALPSLTLFSF